MHLSSQQSLKLASTCPCFPLYRSTRVLEFSRRLALRRSRCEADGDLALSAFAPDCLPTAHKTELRLYYIQHLMPGTARLGKQHLRPLCAGRIEWPFGLHARTVCHHTRYDTL